MTLFFTLMLIVTILQPIQKKEVAAEAVTQIFEAEDATLSEGAQKSNSDSFSGGGYVENINGSSIETAGVITYEVEADEAGRYILEMGYSTMTNTKIAVSVNDGDWQEVSISLTSSTTWDKVKIQATEITLKKGENTIKITGAIEEDTWIIHDYITLKPEIIKNALGVHEAEDALISGGGIVMKNSDAGSSFSGTGYVEGLDASNPDDAGTITYIVNAEETGNYILGIAYAAQAQNGSGTIRNMSVKINDENWQAYEISAATEAWESWDKVGVKKLEITLEKGRNTISVTGETNGSTLIYDYIRIEKENIPNAVGVHEAEKAQYDLSYNIKVQSGALEEALYGEFSEDEVVGLNPVESENIDKYARYIKQKVYAQKSGTYTLELAYATPIDGAELVMKIDHGNTEGTWKDITYVDDQGVEQARLPKTDADTTRAYYTAGTVRTAVTLQEGINTIYISGPIGSISDNFYQAVNLDYIAILETEDDELWKVVIDNQIMTKVEDGGTYTFGDAKYGYYENKNGEKQIYKPKTDITVYEDRYFTTINKIEVKTGKGASIRKYLNDDLSIGIRFYSIISSDNEIALADQGLLTTGMLITTNDIYKNYSDSTGEGLEIDSDCSKMNIVNSGWFDMNGDGEGDVGVYCGSIMNVASTNYTREFIARGYVTIHYADGSTETIYDTEMSEPRSPKYVALAVQSDSAEYTALTAEERTVIDTVAAAQ